MSSQSLRDSQLEMAQYLRDPESSAAPEGVEARRMQVYLDLVYNNVEGFISGGFPVLRTLYEEAQWEELVRSFLRAHRCRSPYFLEISEEFIAYLMNEHKPRECDPAFMAELAHYEWVELALDVSEEHLPDAPPIQNISEMVLQLAPTAWLLSYQYPVHKLGSRFRPASPGQPTHLVVYRNRDDDVKFIELNTATAALLALARDNDGQTCENVLRQLAEQTGLDHTTIVDFGLQQLEEFLIQGVLMAR